MFFPVLGGVGLGIKVAKEVITYFTRSLTRQEVLEEIKKLPKALDSKGKPKTRIYLVKSKGELMKLWNKLTKNFKKEHIETNEKGIRTTRILDDDTAIRLRNYLSKESGNKSTIDIKINDKSYKIHINKK